MFEFKYTKNELNRKYFLRFLPRQLVTFYDL